MREPLSPNGPTIELFEIDAAVDLSTEDVRARALETLERGSVVYLRERGFELTARERQIVADPGVVLPGRKERESRTGRPTLIFNPASNKIERTRIRPPERQELEAMMARYAQWAQALVDTLLPHYGPALERDRLTFRPCERSVPQGIHVDSSYGHPTQGRCTLRVFCNVNPADRPRLWHVGEPFEPFVKRFVPSVRRRNPRAAWLIERLGITHGRRTAYDCMVEDIRRLVKDDVDYQKNAPRKVVEFPRGSTWLAITDLVLHAAVSGQHSLDQTFFLPFTGMRDPSRSPLRILERLSGESLG